MSGTLSYSIALRESTTETISSGVISTDRNYVVIAAETGTSDDLDTITSTFDSLSVNGNTYYPPVMFIADAGDTITIKHGTGNIDLPDDGDITLTDDNYIVLIYNGTIWRAVAIPVVGGGAVIETGTAEGQMTYWDNVANEWKHTETTELVWDDTNKRLGVGQDTPLTQLHVNSTNAIIRASVSDSGETAQIQTHNDLDKEMSIGKAGSALDPGALGAGSGAIVNRDGNMNIICDSNDPIIFYTDVTDTQNLSATEKWRILATGTLKSVDSAAIPPINVTARSAEPSTPQTGDIYLDDGTNTGNGNTGLRRWTGAVWEDVGGVVTGGNTVPIANGGTGQTAKTAAFDALSPVTTAGDIIYRDASNNVRLAIGTADQVLTVNAGATAPEWAAAGGAGATSRALVEDQKAQNTDGGTFTQGARRGRDLNVIVSDPDDIVSIWYLDFTSGGTYEVVAGNVVEGATSGATATVFGVELDSGTWAGGDAAGTLWLLDDQVGTFESENLDVGANLNVATIAADAVNDGTHALLAGTYYVNGRVPGQQCGNHQSYYYNATDTADVSIGESVRQGTSDVVCTRSVFTDVFTIAALKVLQVQGQCSATRNTIGFGEACNLAIEVYTRLEIIKEA